MRRIHPETDLERQLMCLGAMYIEENNTLDSLYSIIGFDVDQSQELPLDIKEQVLDEVGDYFLRLDMNFGPEAQGDCLDILEEIWGIRNKEEVLKSLAGIRIQGHRTKFNILRQTVPQEGSLDQGALTKFKQIFQFDFVEGQELQLKDEDYQKLAQWFQRTRNFISDVGILAWDLARHIQLVRLSFVAGYLDDNEAWAEVLKLAPLTTGQFKSWIEFSQSFLIGRTFWSGSEDPAAKQICERLLGHPASPWNFYTCTEV